MFKQSMHEFSIASSLIEIANKTAEKEGGGKILEIEVEIGQLAGVVINSLAFAFESITRGSGMDDVKLTIREITGQARCVGCKVEFDTSDYLGQCPECGEFNPEIIQGRELSVKSIVIDK